MLEVSASEFDLLSITRALFGAEGAAVDWLLRRGRSLADRMSPQAVDLVESTIAKGWVLALARRGGWRRLSRARPGDSESTEERLWHWHESPALQFSPFTMELLRWLTHEPLGGRTESSLSEPPRTLGDELVAYLALELTDAASCWSAVAKQPAVWASALCWLAYPDRLGMFAPIDKLPSFSNLATGAGAAVVDGLVSDLADKWVAMERRKCHDSPLEAMQKIGRAQVAVLDGFADAADAAGCRDLLRFAVEAAIRLVADEPTAETWVTGVSTNATMSQRSEALLASVAFVGWLERIQRWVRDAQTVQFFDDSYGCAQLLLSLWEPLGDIGYRRLQSIAGELSSFRGLEGEQS